MKYNTIPQTEVIENTAKKLTENGFKTEIVESSQLAKEKVLSLIKKGGQVLTMTSVTLEKTGIAEAINSSDNYESVRNALNSMTKETDVREMKRLGAAPEYAVGSAQAITETGEIIIASNTGSQIPAYAYGADHVILVVGAQKIVSDREEAMKRLYDYVLPLESVRAHEAYGVPGSNISKLMVIAKEIQPERIHIIIVKESLGF